MKNIYSTILLTLSATCMLQARTWTSTAGTTVEGDLVEFANRIAVIQKTDGSRLPVQLQLLSAKDQEFIKEWKVAKNSGSALPSGSGKLNANLAKLLPEQLLDSGGEEVSRDQLAGKTVGFYFSAHWCGPCRAFTPSLVKFRDANKKDFEIVFVSSDRSPAAQMGYMKESKMKWLTMKHRSKEANALKAKYGVSGIPALIIVNPEGETVTKNGRGDVSRNPKGALASWQKP